MLSDVFPRNRLARAMAVYSIGVPLGAGIAMILGSFVVQAVLAAPAIDLPLIGPVEAWRTVFLWVAAPGLIVCLLLLTIREPLRRRAQSAGGDAAREIGRAHVWTPVTNAPIVCRLLTEKKQ